MSLFTDKYVPLNLNNTVFHKNIYEKIKNLVIHNNIPHLLIYGKHLSGKSTLINTLLYDIYGESSKNIKKVSLDIKISNTSNTHSINYIKNINFIIYSISHKISYDKYILKELTNFFTESANINNYIEKSKYRILIIKNAEYLSLHAQAFLRRTMEKYSEYCRFILHTQQLCSLIEPIRSRCLPIRVPSISNDECLHFCNHVIKSESLTINDNDLNKLIKTTNNNIYDILLIMQANIKNNEILIDFNKIKLSYQLKLDEIIQDILKKKSIDNLLEIKQKIYKQLISNIDYITIIRYIKDRLFDEINKINIDNKFEVKMNLINIISECQSKIITGNKSIFYFEYLFFQLNNYLTSLNISD